MSQPFLFPGEIQKLDVLIAAVLQDRVLLPRLLAHDATLYQEYEIAQHTQQRLQCIQAESLQEYCLHIQAKSCRRKQEERFENDILY